MRIEIRNTCTDFRSYRAERVKSLFNAESGASFSLDADLPIDDSDWSLGVVVGPSGSGKSSIGRKLFGGGRMYQADGWRDDAPIIDCIAPSGSFDDVTAALSSVGLGSVPSWLRPYAVLSNGERFRADMARIISEQPAEVVVDEFTSVVDRQIAKFGAMAFSKAWRRTGGRCVLLSCHYDILEWLEPDWVFDTAAGKFAGRGLRRPRFDLALWETDKRYWHLFEPHYYLKLPSMINATYYVGTVDGELVAHVGVGTTAGFVEARASRLVVMPEWQGAGVGMRFLNAVCARWRAGGNRWSKKMTTVFHTSHPGLCSAFRRDPDRWTQVSAQLHGVNKNNSARSMIKSARGGAMALAKAGYGGHMRAVQGFRYIGPGEAAA